MVAEAPPCLAQCQGAGRLPFGLLCVLFVNVYVGLRAGLLVGARTKTDCAWLVSLVVAVHLRGEDGRVHSQAHGVKPVVHVDGGAGDGARHRGRQEGRRVAHLLRMTERLRLLSVDTHPSQVQFVAERIKSGGCERRWRRPRS